MSIEFDIWNALKGYINNLDRSNAADNLVSLLIDEHGLDPADIKEIFKSDKDVRRAIDPYVQNESEEEEEEDEDYDDYDEEDEDY